MTKLSSLATATALASLLLMGVASAQTAAPAKTEPPKTEAPKTTAAPKTATRPAAPTPEEKKARTAISLECSKQADEKKLHGKERKKFRSECKKTAGEKAS